MKRFCMIEITMILASFLALVKGYVLLANILMAALVYLTFLLNRNVRKVNVVLGTAVLFLIMHALGTYGDLYYVYDGLDGVLLALSLHLALMYEYLNHAHNIFEAFKPFLLYFIFTFTMLLCAILVRDNPYFAMAYPKGVVSLLVLIMLMCMPYLMTMACSFLKHN